MYYGLGAAALLVAFGIDWPPEITLRLTFFIGLLIYGIFGAFTYYLPELYPPDIRGLGTGFTFNVGRLGAAFGPLLVGIYASKQADPLAAAINALRYLAVLPILAVLLTPFILETRKLPIEN